MWSQGCNINGTVAQKEMPASHRHMHHPICEPKFTAHDWRVAGDHKCAFVFLEIRQNSLDTSTLLGLETNDIHSPQSRPTSALTAPFIPGTRWFKRQPPMSSLSPTWLLIRNTHSFRTRGWEEYTVVYAIPWKPEPPLWQFWPAGLYLMLECSQRWGNHYLTGQHSPF